MTIRDKILNRLDEAAKMHHQFTAHYTLKNEPRSQHYKQMSVDKKHSKEEAEKMVRDHIAKNDHVKLSHLGYKEVNKNTSPLDGKFAQYMVHVNHTKPGKKIDDIEKVHFDKIDNDKDAENKAKEHILKKYPGSKINSVTYGGSTSGR